MCFDHLAGSVVAIDIMLLELLASRRDVAFDVIERLVNRLYDSSAAESTERETFTADEKEAIAAFVATSLRAGHNARRVERVARRLRAIAMSGRYNYTVLIDYREYLPLAS